MAHLQTKTKNEKKFPMKMKLTLLAAVILAAIGSSAAIAGRDKAPDTKKPAGMSCCATAPEAPAPAAEKETPAKTEGMSCHSESKAAKSCCK